MQCRAPRRQSKPSLPQWHQAMGEMVKRRSRAFLVVKSWEISTRIRLDLASMSNLPSANRRTARPAAGGVSRTSSSRDVSCQCRHRGRGGEQGRHACLKRYCPCLLSRARACPDCASAKGARTTSPHQRGEGSARKQSFGSRGMALTRRCWRLELRRHERALGGRRG